MYNMDSAVQI